MTDGVIGDANDVPMSTCSPAPSAHRSLTWSSDGPHLLTAGLHEDDGVILS